MENTVVLGLSGGVDSAEAAERLQRQGFRVEGVWLDLGFGSPEPARETARQLGIGFHIEDAAALQERLVRVPFCEAYLRGKTPNPCAHCNPLVKLPSLLAAAERLGADRIATGHYSRVAFEDGRFRLYASGGDKDQSYMLSLLPQELLSRLLLPLSGMDKPSVRAAAGAAGLSAANAKDSQDICFIPDGDYAAWLERRGVRLPEGDFVTTDGTVLGRHGGIHRYTVGQRRGLGISAESRLYVLGFRADRDQVVVGRESELLTDTVTADSVNWVSVPPQTRPFEAELKLRSGPRRVKALVSPGADGSLTLKTETPVRRPASGQLAVGYRGDMLLFGAGIL